MAHIEFYTHDAQPYAFPESSAVKRVMARISSWADVNGFERVAFWQDEQDPQKFHVQLAESRLAYWIPDSAFLEGKQDIEAQLDYARGAFRRESAGYGKFDR